MLNKYLKVRWKLLIVIFIILLSFITSIIDYKLALKEQPPIFAIQTKLYKDGGTAVHYGLGYKVINNNQLDGRKDVIFKSLFFSKSSKN
jgi:hypothetical protein